MSSDQDDLDRRFRLDQLNRRCATLQEEFLNARIQLVDAEIERARLTTWEIEAEVAKLAQENSPRVKRMMRNHGLTPGDMALAGKREVLIRLISKTSAPITPAAHHRFRELLLGAPEHFQDGESLSDDDQDWLEWAFYSQHENEKEAEEN